MYFYGFAEHSNTVLAYLGINFVDIASSPLWTSTGETTATLKFCGRLEVYYDGSLVNFHETKLTTEVNLLDGGGFETATLGLDMVKSQEVGETAAATVDYPLSVFCCDGNAQQISCLTTTSQGTPIQICVELATPQTGFTLRPFTMYSILLKPTIQAHLSRQSMQEP